MSKLSTVQVFLQQKAALGLWQPNLAASPATVAQDPQQKLSQMLQIAQFQVYLASKTNSSINKTENEAREDLQ